MSATGLEVFDRTIHETNIWLRDLTEILACADRQETYASLRATLYALRDRLTIEEAVQFAAQLPMLIRGFYFEGWDPTGKPVKERLATSFSLESIASSDGMKSTLSSGPCGFSPSRKSHQCRRD
jgi:uncharacterized protein (DUF2267 family)